MRADNSENEEGPLHQVADIPYLKLDGFVRSIRSNEPAFPLFLDMEKFRAICVLTDRKAGSDFPTELMSFARLE
jgi:hypothetical protein